MHAIVDYHYQVSPEDCVHSLTASKRDLMHLIRKFLREENDRPVSAADLSRLGRRELQLLWEFHRPVDLWWKVSANGISYAA